MCGIAGFFSQRHAPRVREDALGRMLAAQAHRGPDDSSFASLPDATFGMRRLAIFDPANGRQPMVSPDGRHHLIFNGAIYNFRELRPDLAARGWTFRTACDTEVLLAALALDGEAALPRLRGMFGFAFWDAHERSLLAARDALGIKPLLYHHGEDGALLLASETRALLHSRHVPDEVDPEAVAAFLRRLSIPPPRTLHRGIRSLRPGELLRWSAGSLTIAPWWTPAAALAEPSRPPRAPNVATLRAALRERLEDSIRTHLAADVPVGAFLSGGLDSAVVVALMRRLGGGERLKTFSIGFAEKDYSETAEAAATARHLGVEHHAHVLTGAAVAADLDKILASLDAPTGDGINTYYASRIARLGGVTVALSGLGADELFGGYPSFRQLARLGPRLPLWHATPEPLRRAALATFRILPGPTHRLAAALEAAHTLPAAGLALDRRTVFSTSQLNALLAPAGTTHPPHPATEELAAAWDVLRAGSEHPAPAAWAALAGLAEIRGYMSELLLRDSDEFSMRHSLELRTPFVDLPLASWAWAQDPALLLDPRSAPKSHLAAACADLLPPGLLTRRKRGFTLPFARWLRGPLRPFMEETLGSASAGRSGLFDPYLPGRLWRTYRDGRDDHAWSRLWSLAILISLVNRREGPPTG